MKNLAFIIILLSGAVFTSSCVSKKKFLQSEAGRLNCSDSLKTWLAKAAALEEDTTQWGIKYRNLMNEKNFLEESSTTEKKYLSGELTSREKQLQNKEQGTKS